MAAHSSDATLVEDVCRVSDAYLTSGDAHDPPELFGNFFCLLERGPAQLGCDPSNCWETTLKSLSLPKGRYRENVTYIMA